MKKLFVTLLLLLFIIACDDGDFDVPSFNFEGQTIEECANLILFKINENEALIIELNSNNNTVFTTDTSELNLNDAISYRIFNDNITSSYFCNDIPPTTPTIKNEWNGSGTLFVENIIARDDNDSIDETDLELDTDGDQIPNYYDFDDDGDGIKTINEIETDTDGNIILTDTDHDGIPNYLEEDDDGDGVLTINESYTEDDDNDGVVDYLDFDTQITLEEPNLNEPLNNVYTLFYNATFTIENMSLSNSNGNDINHDIYNYGTKTGNLAITSN